MVLQLLAVLLVSALFLGRELLRSPQPHDLIRGIWLPARIDPGPIVSSVAVSDRHWFVGTRNSGVFWSWDHGWSWYPCFFDLPSFEIEDLYFDSNGGELFAVTSAGLARTRIFRCFWEPVAGPDASEVIGRRTADGLDLMTVSWREIHSSPDGGRSWIELPRPGGPPHPELPPGLQDVSLPGDIPPSSTHLDATATGVLAALGNQVWEEKAFGSGWRLLSSLAPVSKYFAIRSVVRSPTDPSRILLLYQGLISDGSGMRLSADGGRSWRDLAPPDAPEEAAFTPDGKRLVIALSRRRKAVAHRRPPPYESLLFVTSGEGLPYRWLPIGRLPGQLNALSVRTDVECGLIVASDEGLWTTDDRGKHWSSTSRGLRSTSRFRAMTAWGDRLLGFSASTDSLLISADQGRTWQAWSAGPRTASLPTSIQVLDEEPCRILVTALRLTGSDDCGRTWWTADRRLEEVVERRGTRTLFAFDSRAGGVVRSRDFGKTWTSILPMRRAALAVDPAQPNRVVAGGLSTSDTTYFAVSRDGGESWESMLPPPYRVPISMLRFGAGDGAPLYAATYDLLWRLDSGSHDWVPVLSGRGPVQDLLVPRAKPDVVYACTSGALMGSADRGATWSSPCPRPIACSNLHLVDDGRTLLVTNDPFLWRYISSRFPLRLVSAFGFSLLRSRWGIE